MTYPWVSAYRSSKSSAAWTAGATLAASVGQKSVSSLPGWYARQLARLGYAWKSAQTAATAVTGHLAAEEFGGTNNALSRRTACAGLIFGWGALGGTTMLPPSTASTSSVRFCCWSAPHA